MKMAFVIPYFGKFNNYFQLFLNSCKHNSDVEWFIFTDDRDNYVYPENVRVVYMSFSDMQRKFQEKFDFPLSLDYPYKLCDFKPSYGYVFEDYLKGYDAWGYCDTDLIWGNISRFITPSLLKEYDKIGDLGHCTLIKNTFKNNRAFMLPINGDRVYKRVFSVNHNNSFDEEYSNSINNIFEEHNLKIFPISKFIANIYTKSSNFKLTFLDKNRKYKIEKKSKNVFVWHQGRLVRFVKTASSVDSQDFMYIHMQSRKMKVELDSFDRYKIIPNVFEKLEVQDVTSNTFPKYKYFNLHYFRLRTHNLIDKTEKKIKSYGL
ncbi:DUF6625 family protein [Levilactobacillus enshiensis]|uniref:DUF6625 family protein n=1 Tax=Levilactobacillus enshiensis TaxID=2590213 RepID=UPI00117AEB34|nr:DUF6625 family protein [Levilactobacillus enshiensis]